MKNVHPIMQAALAAVAPKERYPLGLTASDFPIKAKVLRRTLAVDHTRCPECGGFLDTGNECNDCGFDAMPECSRDPMPDAPL